MISGTEIPELHSVILTFSSVVSNTDWKKGETLTSQRQL